MNGKLVLAFVAGVLATAGIFYYPRHQPESTPVVVVQSPVAVADPTPVVSAAESPSVAITSNPVAKPKPRPKATSKPTPGAIAEPVKQPEPPPPSATIAQAPPPAATPSPATSAPAPAVQTPVLTDDIPKEPRATPVIEPKPHVVTLDQGTLIHVRLDEPLASDKNQQGDTFMATLEQPIVVDGFIIAERGSRAEGRVSEVEEAGRVKGLAKLGIELTKITTADGQKIDIRTARFLREGTTSKKEDAAKVGIGAAIGAAIGAIAGGGRGAGVGAASGGAAGGGVVLATRGKPAVLATETKISFRLDEPVTITERLRSSK